MEELMSSSCTPIANHYEQDPSVPSPNTRRSLLFQRYGRQGLLSVITSHDVDLAESHFHSLCSEGRRKNRGRSSFMWRAHHSGSYTPLLQPAPPIIIYVSRSVDRMRHRRHSHLICLVLASKSLVFSGWVQKHSNGIPHTWFFESLV